MSFAGFPAFLILSFEDYVATVIGEEGGMVTKSESV